jgi:hypothetical protein
MPPLGRSESDFDRQRLVKCRALETELVRLVALRWMAPSQHRRALMRSDETQALKVYARLNLISTNYLS